MNVIQFDVVIAGGGPSGCAAAIALKQSGINVCLVDKEHENKRKVGESIPGASVRLLKKLGINGIDSLLNSSDYKHCLVNASSWGNEEWVYKSGIQNPEGGGYHVNRAILDKALLQRAISVGVVVYADMIDNVNPISNQTNLGFTIRFKYDGQKSINTKWLIDATGRKATIGRKFGLKRERIDDQMAAVNWVSTPENDTDHATRIKSVPDGWWYTSLLPDQSRVIGFQSLPNTVSKMYKQPDLFFEKFNNAGILSYEIKKESRLQSIAVEAGLAKSNPVVKNHILCVGDAALSFDPLSSQGIFFALYSGIKGAEAIINCLGNSNIEDKILCDYQSIVQRVFNENRKSLQYFYLNELRYQNNPYWKGRWLF
ncbi:MAG: NAD(P)/FAD-dependent oxidoreductase [Flavobacterium sp.]|nr:NAD(P)/FAD-dependent oxidoreductase [Flavobacterium sp.]